ncbi:hypothetical protein R3P38DRAFT_2760975 [Favolaschia claudopus]|uniref:Ribosomal protein L5 n=1 Tax=Favolaschia claudopus TaxID=2862362 RepID=A0AAW0DWE5_9AGAR
MYRQPANATSRFGRRQANPAPDASNSEAPRCFPMLGLLPPSPPRREAACMALSFGRRQANPAPDTSSSESHASLPTHALLIFFPRAGLQDILLSGKFFLTSVSSVSFLLILVRRPLALKLQLNISSSAQRLLKTDHKCTYIQNFPLRGLIITTKPRIKIRDFVVRRAMLLQDLRISPSRDRVSKLTGIQIFFFAARRTTLAHHRNNVKFFKSTKAKKFFFAARLGCQEGLYPGSQYLDLYFEIPAVRTQTLETSRETGFLRVKKIKFFFSLVVVCK